MIRSLTVLVAAAAFSLPANAADPTIKDVQVGDVLYGPPVAADRLDGAVVFVEHWGVR